MHHAAADYGQKNMRQVLEAILAHDRQQNWPAISYHVVYLPRTREVAWVGDWNTIRYHAAGVPAIGINNVTGIGVCAAVNYEFVDPDQQAIDDLNGIVDWIVSLLPQRLKTVGHKDVWPTICPGGGWWTTWKAKVRGTA